jgi:hypothetical protein
MANLAMSTTLLSALAQQAPVTASRPRPIFAADRYPTGVEQCSWLNWIADRMGGSIASAKQGVVDSLGTLSDDEWKTIGNDIIDGECALTPLHVSQLWPASGTLLARSDPHNRG